MSEFNIDSLEEYEEQERLEESRQRSRTLAIILVFLISICIGIIIYLVLDYYLTGETDPRGKLTPLDVNSTEIRSLYSYVTYGTRGKRNNKFVYSSYVTLASFSDPEKYYYALQFVQSSDFIDTQERNSSSLKIYNLPDTKIHEYMVMFFGPNVSYSNDVHLNYVFPFRVGKMNVGKMEYNLKRRGFDTVFMRYMGDEDTTFDEYYTQLASAYRLENGTILIRENIVYLDIIEHGGVYTVNIYKDFNHQMLLDSKTNLDASMINSSIIDWASYPNVSYIEYTFPLNGVVYYFYSSQLVTG